ncbi:MAG TPA: hypothetical protein VF121_12360 [Thermoanaerobaculia bacterium]|nr:hypothetical protein [Thermoanaerobaculia bacterium]
MAGFSVGRSRGAGTSRGAAAAPPATLIGQPLAAAPGTVLFLSSTCRTSAKLLDELRGAGWQGPLTVAWIVGRPAPHLLPAGAALLEEGRRLAAALGIRATPFAAVVGARGTIESAGPIADLAALVELARRDGQALADRPPGLLASR